MTVSAGTTGPDEQGRATVLVDDETTAPTRRPAGVRIMACPDGPLVVRGDVEVVDAAGQPVPRRRRTVALCRCGSTGMPPWCDGSHKVVGYRTPPTAPGPGPVPDAIGS